MPKRKGIAWGPSNPLYRWQHRKANKGVVTHKKHVTSMPRKRRSWRGRARRWWRRRDKRVPIVPTLALVSTVFTPAPGGNSIFSDLQNGDINSALYDMREKYTGIDANGAFHWDWLMSTWVPVVIAGVVSQVGGRFVNKYFAKIPIVGKYIKL